MFSQILVWHTQTAKKPMPIVMVRSKATLPGSLATLLDQVTMLGVGEVSETTGKYNISPIITLLNIFLNFMYKKQLDGVRVKGFVSNYSFFLQ